MSTTPLLQVHAIYIPFVAKRAQLAFGESCRIDRNLRSTAAGLEGRQSSGPYRTVNSMRNVVARGWFEAHSLGLVGFVVGCARALYKRWLLIGLESLRSRFEILVFGSMTIHLMTNYSSLNGRISISFTSREYHTKTYNFLSYFQLSWDKSTRPCLNSYLTSASSRVVEIPCQLNLVEAVFVKTLAYSGFACPPYLVRLHWFAWPAVVVASCAS